MTNTLTPRRERSQKRGRISTKGEKKLRWRPVVYRPNNILEPGIELEVTLRSNGEWSAFVSVGLTIVLNKVDYKSFSAASQAARKAYYGWLRYKKAQQEGSETP